MGMATSQSSIFVGQTPSWNMLKHSCNIINHKGSLIVDPLISWKQTSGTHWCGPMLNTNKHNAMFFTSLSPRIQHFVSLLQVYAGFVVTLKRKHGTLPENL